MAEIAGEIVHETEVLVRRDFLKILNVAAGAVAVRAIAWPFIDALNPTKDALAIAQPIIDVSGIAANSAAVPR